MVNDLLFLISRFATALSLEPLTLNFTDYTYAISTSISHHFPKVAYLPIVTTREHLTNVMPVVGRYVSDAIISNSVQIRAIKELSRHH